MRNAENACLLVTSGVDTAENKPAKKLQKYYWRRNADTLRYRCSPSMLKSGGSSAGMLLRGTRRLMMHRTGALRIGQVNPPQQGMIGKFDQHLMETQKVSQATLPIRGILYFLSFRCSILLCSSPFPVLMLPPR